MSEGNLHKIISEDTSDSSPFEGDESYDFEKELEKLQSLSKARFDALKKNCLDKYLSTEQVSIKQLEEDAREFDVSVDQIGELSDFLKKNGITILSEKKNSIPDKEYQEENSSSSEGPLEGEDTSNDIDDDAIDSIFDPNQEIDEDIQEQVDSIVREKIWDSTKESFYHNLEKEVEDNLRWYLSIVNKYKPFKNAEEEKQCFRRIANGDPSAREEAINRNLKLVYAIAKKYSYQGLDLLDLIQEGNIGLCKAVDRFDYKLNNRFSTYAYWWIRQAIIRALCDKSKLIRLPVYLYERMVTIKKIQERFEMKYHREATIEEIALEIFASPEEVERALAASQDCLSLERDYLVNSDEEAIFEESEKNAGCDGSINWSKFADDFIDTEADPTFYVDNTILADKIDEALNRLQPREKEVICFRNGLNGESVHSLEEIGKHFKVTRERIRQIEVKATEKLRVYLKNMYIDYFGGE